MLIDSHCHLSSPELIENLPFFLAQMQENKVDYALCVATRPDNIETVIGLAEQNAEIYAAIGIHPDEKLPDYQLESEQLLEYAKHPKVVAIGETGLDYYWSKNQDLTWQHERFISHIEVAKQAKLPLVIHTRDSTSDVWGFLRDYNAQQCSGVMHCFSEDIAWARKFLDLGFYISLSGIVTFKNAHQVHEVAKFVPSDRLLIETDAPYLAPVPCRGKLNHPALVKHTAQYVADLRHVSFEELATVTSANFRRLFIKFSPD